jgi:hypothetical protein
VTVRIQLRRGTAAEWISANTVLAAGETGVERDTEKFKIGDGVTAWNSLAYFTGVGGSDPTITPKLASGTIVGHRVVRCVDAAEVAYTDVTDPNQVFSDARDLAQLGRSRGRRQRQDGRRGHGAELELDAVVADFLAANGFMTQTAPVSPAAAFVLCVGYALSATTMRVQIGIPIVLI